MISHVTPCELACEETSKSAWNLVHSIIPHISLEKKHAPGNAETAEGYELNSASVSASPVQQRDRGSLPGTGHSDHGTERGDMLYPIKRHSSGLCGLLRSGCKMAMVNEVLCGMHADTLFEEAAQMMQMPLVLHRSDTVSNPVDPMVEHIFFLGKFRLHTKHYLNPSLSIHQDFLNAFHLRPT